MQRVSEILLELAPYIDRAPMTHNQAHTQACSNDAATIDKWRDQWISQIKSNHSTYGTFAENSVGQLWSLFEGLPTVLVGSGPSLKRNAILLKEKPDCVKVISCLHNFHFMEDNQLPVDFYVTLDAGDITIKEVSEGGSKTEAEYWELTKDRKLLAFIGTHPELLKKWQGEVYFYNAPVPDVSFTKEVNSIEEFHIYIESGGNVLGACTLLSKGILGSSTSIFIGSDFAFSDEPTTKFHSWDSSYDKDIGQFIKVIDIWGKPVKTWQSYYNFKLWFDVLSERIPGFYINASEGGCLGAYRDGNIRAIKQSTLKDALDVYRVHTHKKEVCANPSIDKKIVLI